MYLGFIFLSYHNNILHRFESLYTSGKCFYVYVKNIGGFVFTHVPNLVDYIICYSRKNEIEYSIAILIKLLIDIEDQIWSEINRGKFMLATELLQLAVHIKTGIKP